MTEIKMVCGKCATFGTNSKGPGAHAPGCNADILSKRPEKAAKPKTKLVKRWVVVFGDKCSAKIYTHAEVRKLVSRAKRMGLDCYPSPLTIRV